MRSRMYDSRLLGVVEAEAEEPAPPSLPPSSSMDEAERRAGAMELVVLLPGGGSSRPTASRVRSTPS